MNQKIHFSTALVHVHQDIARLMNDELHEVSLHLYTKPIRSFSTFLFNFLYSFYCLVKCNVHKSPFSINKFHKIVLQKFEMTCHKKKKTKHNFMIDNHAIIIISYKKK
jgi:hypothetical protein